MAVLHALAHVSLLMKQFECKKASAIIKIWILGSLCELACAGQRMRELRRTNVSDKKNKNSSSSGFGAVLLASQGPLAA